MDGPARIKEVRAEWRRGQIIAAATRLMEKDGFHSVSVSDVAKEAGISVGTIYQYLSNKEDILLLVITDILDEYAVRLPAAIEQHENGLARLVEGFREYCRIVDERRSATALAYRESRTLSAEGLDKITKLERSAIELIEACIRDARDNGDLMPSIDAPLVAIDLVMLAHMWALKQWYFKGRFEITEYADAQLALVLGSLLADPASPLALSITSRTGTA